MSGVQMFSKMFGLGRTPKNIITLFHKPSSPASMRVHNQLKQAAAAASSTATEDQASDHSPQEVTQRNDFDLDVVEAAPTPDQLQSMLEYSGGRTASALVQGATSSADAIKKLKESPELFKRPVVVDWIQGKIVAGEDESELVKLVKGSSSKGS